MSGGLVAVVIGLILVAIYSPLLALRTITVDGVSRVSEEAVIAAVSDQLGTPLALIDYDRITRNLGTEPLIRSYVTEAVPPGTLIVHISERQPVGAVPTAGGFDLVDPAGVVVQSSPDRPVGLPVIEAGGGDVSSPPFDAAVEVLLALPPSLLAQVDSVAATSKDDVSLVLVGVGQRVVWGSADNSARKASVLAALMSVTDPARRGEFDVSAPSNGVFSPG